MFSVNNKNEFNCWILKGCISDIYARDALIGGVNIFFPDIILSIRHAHGEYSSSYHLKELWLTGTEMSHFGDISVLTEFAEGLPSKSFYLSRGSIPEFFHIMKRKFTNKEWETIRSFKDEWTQLDMFYRNWALKESFIKAIGVGLGFELQRLEFDISPLNLDIGEVYKETRLFLDGEEEKEWAFEVRNLDTEVSSPVFALRKPNGSRHKDVSSQDDSIPTQRQFTILTFNDLISSAVPMTPEDPSFWDCFCFTEEIPIRNGTKS
uniref:L-aminoadipate-semialdehyde dehydrogenase-phosphopantetheinyl transferase n=1 Tax=Spermophilus dauricus TaxID=99837 RepID=A0A8C9PSP5_SPEDA